MEPAGANLAVPRGLLAIGGASVARHQLALALALGCRRVICIAREFSPGMLALQHQAERGDAQFHVVTGSRQLSVLVTSGDELIVLADGMMAAPAEVATLLEQGPAVLVQPIEVGLAGGFERIDINHAAAGAMRIAGALAERLNELPSDCDIVSALTRIALQSGVRQRPVSAEMRERACWRLVRDEDEAHAAENDWIALHLGEDSQGSPGAWLARAIVQRFGPTLLHAGNGSRSVVIGAGVALLLALALGWFGYAGLALGLLGLAWLVRRAGALLARVERDSLQLGPALVPREALFGVLLDGAAIVLCVWGAPDYEPGGLFSRAFGPAMLFGLLRIVPPGLPAAWGGIVEDRLLVCMALAVAAASGPLGLSVKILALAIAVVGLAGPAITSRITRT